MVWTNQFGYTGHIQSIEMADVNFPPQLTEPPVLTTNGLLVRWTSTAGQSYRLLSTSDPGSRTWTPIGGPVVATETWCEYRVARPTANQAFFRVEQLK